MKSKATQKEVILWMLESDQMVNPSNVFKVTKKTTGVGCMKLSTRIGELIKEGYKINKIPVVNKKSHFMSYELK